MLKSILKFSFPLLFLVLALVIVFVSQNINKKSEDTQNIKPRIGEKRMVEQDQIQDSSPLGALLNSEAKNRVSSDITAKIPQVNPEDAEQVRRLVLDEKDSPYVRNEGIDLLRRSGDPHLDETLVQVLRDNQQTELMRDFSVQHLFVSAKKADPHTRKEIEQILVHTLDDESELVRREAFLALTRLKHEKPKEIIRKHIDNPEYSYLRDLMIRGAQKYDLKEVLPSVRQYLQDPYDVNTVAAISAVGLWKDKESEKVLELLSKHKKDRIRRVAETALNRIYQSN